MDGLNLYCQTCNKIYEPSHKANQNLHPASPCPDCNTALIIHDPPLPPENSNEFESEMFFLGHEGLFDDFFF